MEDVCISKKEIADLVQLTEEINERVESLELMSNKKFMASYKKAKEQIKKRDFAEWDEI
jgi:hypothetical protein